MDEIYKIAALAFIDSPVSHIPPQCMAVTGFGILSFIYAVLAASILMHERFWGALDDASISMYKLLRSTACKSVLPRMRALADAADSIHHRLRMNSALVRSWKIDGTY